MVYLFGAVVIQMMIEIPKPRTVGEYDFWIISYPLRTIVQIEAKRSNASKARKSAKIQLEKGFDFLRSKISLPEQENWKFVKSIWFDDTTDQTNVCKSCSTLVLHCKDSDFEECLKNWWDSIDTFQSCNGTVDENCLVL